MSLFKRSLRDGFKKPILLAERIRRAQLIALTTTGLVTCSFNLWPAPDNKVPYPSGFRQWAHVKSALISPPHPLNETYGGFHHIYANEKAMEGYRSGKFPDGALIVFDVREAQAKDGLTTEGPRRFIDVMARDSRLYAETGGWGFEKFWGDSPADRKLDARAAAACFACHAKQKEGDYVFSAFPPESAIQPKQ
ncbi:MAG: cytochrome P460 family protein [Blastocatellales bacterium]